MESVTGNLKSHAENMYLLHMTVIALSTPQHTRQIACVVDDKLDSINERMLHAGGGWGSEKERPFQTVDATLSHECILRVERICKRR